MIKILLAFFLLSLSSCSLSYVVKQGVFQFELLAGSEPIEIALRSNLDLKKRKKLELIEEIRAFAKEKMGLKTKNYQNVNLTWDRALYTVSASNSLKFEPYRWWFPIIGLVPYKGFFDIKDAFLEQQKLTDLGFDTQLGRVDGYSTLGYFSDPVWPSMLNLSDSALTELIIHELTHETIYFANQTTFNESLASFVAKMGTKSFTEEKFGKHSQEIQAIDSYQKDQEIYSSFFHDLYQKLDSIYHGDQSPEQKAQSKKATLEDAKQRYLKLEIEEAFKKLDWSRVNNAYLMAFKSYHHDDPVFKDLFNVLSGDFKRFILEISYYGRSEDPFKSLKERFLKLQGQGDEKS